MIGKKIGVLFVCMGNICRSPTAEGVFRAMAERAGQARDLRIDSAGTDDYHVGEPPDPRRDRHGAAPRLRPLESCAHAQVAPRDFARFDWILAMDAHNLNEITHRRPRDYAGHIGLLLDLAPDLGVREVPDPYYGGAEGFERILDLIEPASEALLAQIAARTGEA